MESESTTELPGEKKPTKLVDVKITTPQEALQLIATFLNLAQKRGAFSLDESAKIWECIQQFK